MHKIVNGKKIELSIEEENKILAEWAENERKQVEDERLNGYKRKRSREYPRIEDQLDMLFHAMDQGILTKVPEFYNKIKEIKDKYPKPIV